MRHICRGLASFATACFFTFFCLFSWPVRDGHRRRRPLATCKKSQGMNRKSTACRPVCRFGGYTRPNAARTARRCNNSWPPIELDRQHERCLESSLREDDSQRFLAASGGSSNPQARRCSSTGAMLPVAASRCRRWFRRCRPLVLGLRTAHARVTPCLTAAPACSEGASWEKEGAGLTAPAVRTQLAWLASPRPVLGLKQSQCLPTTQGPVALATAQSQ